MNAITKKYRQMPFMMRYADLFAKSNIIEKIVPRQIQDPAQLELFYPDLLNQTSS